MLFTVVSGTSVTNVLKIRRKIFPIKIGALSNYYHFISSLKFREFVFVISRRFLDKEGKKKKKKRKGMKNLVYRIWPNSSITKISRNQNRNPFRFFYLRACHLKLARNSASQKTFRVPNFARLTSSMNFNFYSSTVIFDVSARARRIHQLKHVQLHGQLPAEFIYGSRG